MNHSIESSIIETRVADADRINFLPRHFGSRLITLEHWVYAQLSHLSEDYRGGYWDYFELSNGGCYMAPLSAKTYRLRVEGNGYFGQFDAKSAGIIACLFSYSVLSFRHRDVERFSARFHQLRDFALERPNAGEILAAID